ncbi:hypothetical protein V5H98_15365 [Georgenia sp. M64]|uniref:hypothetical protein n=1 Tax=Georgenia sp. M64 TaxID=3120520 RepID=UPI0030E241EB
MSHRAIPADLRALAGQVAAAAARTEEVAADLPALGERAGWGSTAGDRFREDLARRAADTARTAALVRDVEAALRAQAESVEERIALVDAARSWVADRVDEARGLIGQVWDGVVDAVGAGVDEAQRVLDVAARAPDDELDPGWLDTARSLGR